jgi:hypothetical protein
MEDLPLSRFTDTFPFPNVSTFFFSSPLHLAITFQFSAIPHGRQTPPLLPLSTLWHFPYQLLSAVAKVTSSVFCSSFRGEHISPFYFSSQRLNLPVSLVSPPFTPSPPSVGIPFQSTYKQCCSETGCPSSNTEFQTSTIHKSLFRPLFLSPHSPLSPCWVYISEPDNLNLYRRSRHFTCLLSLPVSAP